MAVTLAEWSEAVAVRAAALALLLLVGASGPGPQPVPIQNDGTRPHDLDPDNSCRTTSFGIISHAHLHREGEILMQYLRTGGRIPIELPVEIQWKTRTGTSKKAQGMTSSISSNGVFMTVPVKLPLKTAITISVNLPVEFTRIPLRLLCRARVVWQSARPQGLGAVIDDYQLRPVRRPR